MLTKKAQRLRRARQTRIRIAEKGVARLSVNRTNLHIYATVVSEDGAKVLASASTAEAEMRKSLGASGKGATLPPQKPLASASLSAPRPPAWKRLPSTAQVSHTTAASRRSPKQPVKRVCSSKTAGQTNGKVSR